MDATTKNLIKNNFLQKHIILSEEWLEQCLEWIESQYPNETITEIENKVYCEWLTLDLRDVELPILPPNINEAIEFTLHEIIHLQLMYVIDISKPKYSQLRKMRSGIDDHTDDGDGDSTSSRMLKLVLSDGVQEISALEYKKIECLHLNLPPGLKICLKPPITIRRGQIMLKPEMIRLCGGSLFELEISNCPENILAAALNQPLNNNPKGVNVQVQDAAITTQQVNDSQRTSVTINQTNQTTHKNSNANVNDIYEEDFDDIMNDEFFENHFKAIELSETRRVEETAVQNYLQPSTSRDYIEDNYDEECYIYDSPPCPPPPPLAVTPLKRPILPIEKLNRMRSNITKGLFAIEAEVDDIVEKLTTSDAGFAMKVIVADETGDMDVRLHSKVITQLIELEPEAFLALGQSAESENTNGVRLFMEKLQKFVDKLRTLKAKFVVTIEANKDPIITDILEYISS